MPPHKILADWAQTQFEMPDPGASGELDMSGFGIAHFPIVTAAAEGRTLPVPTKSGLMAGVSLKTDGGDLTLTVTSGYEQAGTTTMTFDDAGDSVLFYSVETSAGVYRWRILASDGITGPVSQETATFGSDIASTAGTLDVQDGGTVTQATSITTGVTLNTHSGQITTVSSTLAAAAEATFTVTNSTVSATDVVIAHLGSTSSAGTPLVVVSAVAAGSFDVTIANLHASAALDNTMVINFVVIKGASS